MLGVEQQGMGDCYSLELSSSRSLPVASYSIRLTHPAYYPGLYSPCYLSGSTKRNLVTYFSVCLFCSSLWNRIGFQETKHRMKSRRNQTTHPNLISSNSIVISLALGVQGQGAVSAVVSGKYRYLKISLEGVDSEKGTQ